MIRWQGVLLGIVSLASAHAVEVVTWKSWFNPTGDLAPWFLNAGAATAFTAGCLFLASAVAAAFSRAARANAIAFGFSCALGAVIAMAIILGATGPGTLFPIVLAFGAVIGAASSVSGALAGAAIRRPIP